MRATLVSMPWQQLSTPSTALGCLAAVAGRHEVTCLYGNLKFANRFADATVDGKPFFDLGYYELVSSDNYVAFAGEWVFAPACYGTDEWRTDDFVEMLAHYRMDPAPLLMLQAEAGAFIDDIVEEILAGQPELVGFTTSFQQNIPSLAAARRLKERAPNIKIIFGGANCDGDQGFALFEAFDCIDLLIRGEGDTAFPMLLDALEAGSTLVNIPGLCWRDGETIRNNLYLEGGVTVADLPFPDYSDWFVQFGQSVVSDWVEPEVMLETSRGCWWGEKHHCTFCGLNDSTLNYRSRPPEQAIRLFQDAVDRWGVTNLYTVDNILSPEYFDEVVPALEAFDVDIRMFYEVKSNLTRAQLEQLAAARITILQPGVESLSTKVLRLMDKGTTGVNQVQMLRDALAASITLSWNFLIGFPGETDDDYEPMVSQLPALVHLQPPGGATPVHLERFSPLLNNPSLGMPATKPGRPYPLLYDAEKVDLWRLAYFFETEQVGASLDMARRLSRAIDTWQAGYLQSHLEWFAYGGELVVVDDRVGWPQREHVLCGADARLYRALGQHLGLTTAARAADLSVEDTRDICDQFVSSGLCYTDGGRYVALAIDAPAVARKATV